jgi:hypothetical protein
MILSACPLTQRKEDIPHCVRKQFALIWEICFNNAMTSINVVQLVTLRNCRRKVVGSDLSW